MFIERMDGQDYIDKTREYLDYLEKHINNIARAFQEVSEACDGMAWVGDDFSWHTLRNEVEQHDLSKFTKEEFTQYRDNFCPTQFELDNPMSVKQNFGNAWNHHKRHNPHHHESIRYEAGLPGLTELDIVHMIVDWTAMSYKFGGSAQSYYEANADKITVRGDFLPFMYEVFSRIRKYNDT